MIDHFYCELNPNYAHFFVAGLYALINNAGVCVCGEFDWQTWKHIQAQVNVNILGTLRVIKAFLPLLKVSTDPGTHLHFRISITQ